MDADTIAKAQAIKSEHKALGVVCFGYFRYRNARFGCAEVHQAIQCYGRDGMTRAKDIARDEGFTMVHALTDCAFLQKPGVTREEVLRLTRRIGTEVGVAMDLEGIYRWVVFLGAKTHSTSSDVGAPNRYYGKFSDGTLKARGIEVQRHSTPDWIHDTQQRMLQVLGEADDSAGFMARIPRALDVAHQAALRLRERKVAATELGTMVQATRSVEEYVADTNTKAALRRLRDAGTERRPGEYVKYVVARQDGPKPSRVVPIELFSQASPWFGDDLGVQVHIEHYIRLLARSVETLLSPFGYTEDGLTEWLTGRAHKPKAEPAQAMDPTRRPTWTRA